MAALLKERGSDSERLASTEILSITCLLYYSFQLIFLLIFNCKQAIAINQLVPAIKLTLLYSTCDIFQASILQSEEAVAHCH